MIDVKLPALPQHQHGFVPVDSVVEYGQKCADAATASLRAELDKLRAFAASAMAKWPEDGVDGDALQDYAEAAGLLRRELMTVPCGDICFCAHYCDQGDTTECLRTTDLLRACRQMDKPSTNPAGIVSTSVDAHNGDNQ